MKLCSVLLSFLIILTTACSKDDLTDFLIFNHAFDFNDSDHGWQCGFSDYPSSADTASYELRFAHTTTPSGVAEQKALMLSGNNRSVNLFMFIKKKLTELEPDAEYIITFEVTLASNATEGMVGIGGAHGENVFLKVGATAIEPKSVIEGSMYTMNIDKGGHSEGGEDMVVIGNIATPASTSGYTTITHTNASSYAPFKVRTSSKGELWLIVGTDSGYEGKTTLFYTKINTIFSRAGQ